MIKIKVIKQYLLIGTSLFLLLSCKQLNKNKKAELAKEFLQFYLSKLDKDKAPILLDSHTETTSQQCVVDIDDELKGLGFNLTDFIDQSLLKMNLGGSLQFISKEKLPDPTVPDSWRNFEKQYKNGFYIISAPIVNDKCDSVILYYSYYCDERCGNGGMVLYKKTDSDWKLIKVCCKWVS